MRPILALLSLALVPFTFALGQQSENASGPESVFIHLTDNFKDNDAPVCVAFNVALAAVGQGRKVELFFDEGAAYGLKQWEPGKTDLGLYPLPERLGELLGDAFGLEKEDLPKNYQDYLSMLHAHGVTVTVNGVWNALTGVEDTPDGRSRILPYAVPLSLDEIVQHRAAADTYFKF